MLRLRRKQNQEIILTTASGERIVVKMGRMRGNVIVGIDAPKSVKIRRDDCKDLTNTG